MTYNYLIKGLLRNKNSITIIRKHFMMIRKIKYSIVVLIVFTNWSLAQEHIDIDFSVVTKRNINSGIASANLCWVLDSDKKRPNTHQSMHDAIKELGCGSLRFPYGHLADNYLWHTPPYDDALGGLRPKVAAMSRPPGDWSWAVNSDGSFKAAMDFDEYMAMCQKLDIKPLVVVNVFSYKYKGGPALAQLAEAAAEWVKYANKKNYHVEYWQIGNEVDHHPKLMTKDEYVESYQQIASAMKAVDVSIKVGPGILSKAIYFRDIITKYPDLIDFTSCHQYMWPYKATVKNYSQWKEHVNQYIPNVIKMQQSVQNSSKPDMEIVITESGVSPSNQGMGNINNVYKALWWFEVLMNEISQPNVAYSYFWGSHSPWKGEKDDEKDDVAVLLRLDDNSRKPTAEIVKMVNENMLDKLVLTAQISGYVRTFASISNDGQQCNIFLMNKNNTKEKVVLQLNQLPEHIRSFVSKEYKGKKANDRNIIIEETNDVNVINNQVNLILEPLSVTVLTGK